MNNQLTGFKCVVVMISTLWAICLHAQPSVEDFARLPTFADLKIAPGGKYAAARLNVDNVYTVMVYDISNGGIKPVYGFTEDEELSVSWFRWKSPTYLLASVSFTGTRGSRRRLQTDESRLLSLNAEKAELIALYRDRRGETPVQIQDHIVDFMPNDSDHVLVQYSRENPAEPHVWKVNITKSTSHKRVKSGRRHVFDWISDNNSEVRIGQGVKDDKHPYLTIHSTADGKWHDFSHRKTQPGVSFEPVAFTSDPNQIYVASNHTGDPSGLYIFDIAKDEFVEEIFKHPTVDVLGIDIDPVTAELQSINFAEDGIRTEYLVIQPIEEEIHRMQDQFPGKEIMTLSVSNDGNYAVFRVQAANDPGTYYILDQVTPLVRRLPAQYPTLSDAALGVTFPAKYEARDGLQIPAFVTAPPGIGELDEMRNLPFVVLPHGGPAARDFMGFDYWVQLLVSRGYGVLQMNFRGSDGYGQAFKEAGSREWGQAMQDDITDGVAWLVDGGYADPHRIAIAGGSYGGYAALMGAVKTPELFQCAVSFAGVTDLPDLLSLERQYIGGRYATRFIGDLWRDRKMLAANSPARRTEDIQIPILLVHGNNDTVVDIRQSEKMAKQLRKHDKPHTFVALDDGDHYLSLHQNRLTFLTELDRFMDGCLNKNLISDTASQH